MDVPYLGVPFRYTTDTVERSRIADHGAAGIGRAARLRPGAAGRAGRVPRSSRQLRIVLARPYRSAGRWQHVGACAWPWPWWSARPPAEPVPAPDSSRCLPGQPLDSSAAAGRGAMRARGSSRPLVLSSKPRQPLPNYAEPLSGACCGRSNAKAAQRRVGYPEQSFHAASSAD